MKKVTQSFMFLMVIFSSFSASAVDGGLRQRIRDRYLLTPKNENEAARLNKKKVVNDVACCGICCSSSCLQACVCPFATFAPMVCVIAAQGSDGSISVFDGYMTNVSASACAATACLCVMQGASACHLYAAKRKKN